MRRHLLVTNDFPPKVGGIQKYLWELWRRLDPVELRGADRPLGSRRTPTSIAAQAARGVRIERVPESILFFPTPARSAPSAAASTTSASTRPARSRAARSDCSGPRLGRALRRDPARRRGHRSRPPARCPAGPGPRAAGRRARRLGRRVPGRRGAPGRAGHDRRRSSRSRPAVDTDRLRAPRRRAAGRPGAGWACPPTARWWPASAGSSRARAWTCSIEAAGRLAPSYPDLTVAIAGGGREPSGCAARPPEPGAPVDVLGRVERRGPGRAPRRGRRLRHGLSQPLVGLEQEGFGIVFLEAAAAGVPQVAGDSGGAAEAVLDGVTGLVVRRPEDPGAVAAGPAPAAGRPGRAPPDGRGPPGPCARHPSTTTGSLLGWPRPWPKWQADAAPAPGAAGQDRDRHEERWRNRPRST